MGAQAHVPSPSPPLPPPFPVYRVPPHPVRSLVKLLCHYAPAAASTGDILTGIEIKELWWAVGAKW
jgi:hypothetical protein